MLVRQRGRDIDRHAGVAGELGQEEVTSGPDKGVAADPRRPGILQSLPAAGHGGRVGADH